MITPPTSQHVTPVKITGIDLPFGDVFIVVAKVGLVGAIFALLGWVIEQACATIR